MRSALIKLLRNLNQNIAQVNISNILIKHARTILVKPLTLLAKQIIHTGEFSRQLKIARVKPLYKKKMISQVCQIIAPYICYLLFQNFLRMCGSTINGLVYTNNLFCIQQFGFRPGHSTEYHSIY